MGLEKTLTLQDLVFFGIVSILGSGGFNLIGEAIVKGGSWWPAAFGISSAAFLGASRVYEKAYDAFKTNTAESDFVKVAFGDIGSGVTIASVFIWNILSISTILVLCAHMLFPEGTWVGQISFALFLLLGMASFSLRGLDVNKETINLFSGLLILVLSLLTFIGVIGVGKKGIPGIPDVGNQSFVMSVLFFYFILAGFDDLIKFTEETKDPKDIPRSFYISNAISILLTLGLCLAFVTWVNMKKLYSFENGVGEILQSLLGGNMGFYAVLLAVIYMIMSTFVKFFATTRYMYGLSEINKSLEPLRVLNESKAPSNTIWLTAALAGIGILVNHTEYLIRFSDFGLSTLLVTMSAAAMKLSLDAGNVPWVEGATTAAFAGLMGISFMK